MAVNIDEFVEFIERELPNRAIMIKGALTPLTDTNAALVAAPTGTMYRTSNGSGDIWVKKSNSEWIRLSSDITTHNNIDTVYLKGDATTSGSLRLRGASNKLLLEIRLGTTWVEKASLGGSIETDHYFTNAYGGGLIHRLKNSTTSKSMIIMDDFDTVTVGDLSGYTGLATKQGQPAQNVRPKFTPTWYSQQEEITDQRTAREFTYTFVFSEAWAFNKIKASVATAGSHGRFVITDAIGSVLYETLTQVEWDIDPTTFPASVIGENPISFPSFVTVPSGDITVTITFDRDTTLNGKIINGTWVPAVWVNSTLIDIYSLETGSRLHSYDNAGENIFVTNLQSGNLYQHPWQEMTVHKANTPGTVGRPLARKYGDAVIAETFGTVGTGFCDFVGESLRTFNSSSYAFEYQHETVPNVGEEILLEIWYSKGNPGEVGYKQFDTFMLSNRGTIENVDSIWATINYNVPIEIRSNTRFAYRLFAANGKPVRARCVTGSTDQPYVKLHYRNWSEETLMYLSEQSAATTGGDVDALVQLMEKLHPNMNALQSDDGTLIQWDTDKFIIWEN